MAAPIINAGTNTYNNFDEPPVYDFVLKGENSTISDTWRAWYTTWYQTLTNFITQFGFFIPQLTTKQRDALVNPAGGQLIYNTDANVLQVFVIVSQTPYQGQWEDIDTSILGAFVWQVVTAASDTLVSDNGYISNRPSLIMYTLPLTSAVGDEIRINEINASGTFMISQNAGQNIQVGNVSTTPGVAGSVTSTAVGDSINMVCTVANTSWLAFSVVGNLTVV